MFNSRIITTKQTYYVVVLNFQLYFTGTFLPGHLVPLYKTIYYDKCTVKNSLELAHFVEENVKKAQNYLKHSEYD